MERAHVRTYNAYKCNNLQLCAHRGERVFVMEQLWVWAVAPDECKLTFCGCGWHPGPSTLTLEETLHSQRVIFLNYRCSEKQQTWVSICFRPLSTLVLTNSQCYRHLMGEPTLVKTKIASWRRTSMWIYSPSLSSSNYLWAIDQGVLSEGGSRKENSRYLLLKQ